MRARLLGLLLLGSVLVCSAVSPTLSSVSPAGGKAGSDVEVVFNGARLEDAKELILYSPGIQVMSLEPAKKNTPAKAVLRIAPDCRFGEHQIRIRTLSGITELRTFRVGPFTSVKETELNNELAKAQIIPPNTTVAGTITSEDIDTFKVPMKKGDRLSAEVEAMRLGRVMFDPYLAILDASGKLLAECDDSILFLQDPVVSLVIPTDGFYYVQLRDTSWGGGNDFVYRLHLGNFPLPTVPYPLGGEAGTELALKFLGDPKGSFQRTVTLPKDGSEELSVVAESDGQRSPTPRTIRVSPFPNLFESGENHSLASATLATREPPFAFNGILSKRGEQDWFGFTANKKSALEITVFARRLRSPVDSVLQLCDAKGKVLESNDDSAGADSVIKFTPEETGTYYLKIQDQLDGGGPDFAYRIEVRPPVPRVVLSIPEVARNDTQTRQAIAVPRGNRMATLINAKKANYSGDLTFAIAGLPAGVSLGAEVMPGAVDTMPWVFTAETDAPLAGTLVEPAARPRTSDKALRSSYRHTLELIRGNNDQVYYGTHSSQLAVAVVQETPFTLKLEVPSIPLVRAGSMKLKVSAERRSGFEEPITVKMLWSPPGISAETELVIPKGKSSVDYAINAKGDATLSTWKIVVLGSAPYQGGTVYASSDLAPLRVTEPFILGKILPTNTEPGKTVTIKCQLDQREPFEGKAQIRLLGLPEKATTKDLEITKEDKEVSFEVVVDPKISPGSHKNLFCQVQLKKGEETVVQTVGSGGILRIVPPKKNASEPKKVAAAETKSSGK